jgi:ankyrin repeat protein
LTWQLQPACALIVAAARGDVDAVRQALGAGLAADSTPPGKPSALCYAALSDEVALLELLLDHGADPDFQDAMGNTACIYAALGGAGCCLQRLARLGADLSLRNERQQSAFDCCRDEETRIALTLALTTVPPSHAPMERGRLN